MTAPTPPQPRYITAAQWIAKYGKAEAASS